MGNCIIRQSKIMKMGQEVTRHKESMKVHRVLGCRMLDPLPLLKTSVGFDKNPEIEAETEEGDRTVRIKLVITKQELQVMLRKGKVSVVDFAFHMMKESSDDEAVVIEGEDNRSCGRWKPV